jgi:putative membrane protein
MRTDSPGILPVLGMVGFGSTTGGPWGGQAWSDGTVPGWMVPIGALMGLLFLAATVGAGYLTHRAVTTADGGTGQALEELRVAHARGDLTGEEYEQRKDALERDTCRETGTTRSTPWSPAYSRIVPAGLPAAVAVWRSVPCAAERPVAGMNVGGAFPGVVGFETG